MIVSTSQLGELLNLTERHIYNLEKAQILAKEDKNKWDAAKNIHAYISYKIDLENTSGDAGKIRIRRDLAEAKLKELSYKERIGQLIPIDSVAKELEDIAIIVSNKLYALPHILKRRHKLSTTIANELESQIVLILEELKDPKIYEREALKVEARIMQEKDSQDSLLSCEKLREFQGQIDSTDSIKSQDFKSPKKSKK